VSLRNRYAVRSALLAGIAAFFLSAPLGAFGLFVLAAGGVFAVYLYHRSTGQSVSVANGARLGWITGVFLFVLLLLTFTASVAMEPTFFNDLEKQILERSTMPRADVQQIIDMLRTPVGVAAMVFGMFLSSTLPPALGGAVGAKLLGRS
jgi:zona occludens toxin (predicted ATPase)